ncbi:ABC transporter family substrate-binding protein [Streptomyces ipomoeae]|uniref:ABC transporter family substrate-binding protein n=1 Tax=Streptomyces ipomoeae TaxID=103232 RepID=A0AAE8W7K2_9ACTN|nr:ABC transporter family substrate-binding protein [Streptomyces ipomoeae]TQE25058.1 ABC transporter family substrate-binding protein [Streptomyces ipomoeae]TQE38354.1 ABC transporter family substrate-binding protein [Streptomyces ipomoeae]
MSHDGVGLRAVMRSVAFLTAGALAVPLLSACSEKDPAGKPVADQDIAPADRDLVRDGGTLRWAVDAVPETLNTFQADADATTSRVAGAVLPSMYRLDASGRPRLNPDYLESAKIVEREPKQVVLYKLSQQAVWSDGREIGAADFAAQWRALSGKDSAYWTARNAGYERIEKVERGSNDLEVRVTFARPYTDWKSLFSPLYPKQVTGTPDSFNDGARRKLKVTAGPFALKKVDRKGGEITLTRNPRWWGRPAKLSELVLRAVPRDERVEALVDDKVDVAEVDAAQAKRIMRAGGDRGRAGAGAGAGTDVRAGADSGAGAGAPGPLAYGSDGERLSPADSLRSWAIAHGSDEKAADDEISARKKRRKAIAEYTAQQSALRDFTVRRSLEPAFTQLALNGSDGPLADERVRRAVARALDRKELAALVLKPLGLPAVPVGSHLALAGQAAYADNSGALGDEDTKEARALLADAGWERGGPLKKEKKAAGSEGKKNKDDKDDKDDKGAKGGKEAKGKRDSESPEDDGTYIVGEDNKPYDTHDTTYGDEAKHLAQDGRRYAPGGSPGAYAPEGTRVPADAARGPLVKNGKPLTLRFVLPSGPGTESLRTVGKRIAAMLERIGIHAKISKVADESYFKDHIANGQYDLALYSWPTSAYPATDARPIYAKPVPAADGSLIVEQNYTRVGTDQVDQLFDQAVSTLDESETRSLIRKADARIWAAAGSIPLYQRPQLIATRTNLANTGAFGFQTPVYEDMGFLRKPGRHAPNRPRP